MAFWTVARVAVAMWIGAALWAGDRVVATPGVVEISSLERVVEYKDLNLRSTDSSSFKVLSVRTSRRLVNVLGVVGLATPNCHFLVHLSSTIKPGKYEEVIVFELEDKAQPYLKVPVRIDVQERAENREAALTFR